MSLSTHENRSRRHSARPLAFGCLGLFGVLLLGVLGYLGWANQLPPPEPDTRVMPSPNGYDACLAALMRAQQATGLRPPPDPDSLDVPAIRAAVTSYKPALDGVRTAMRLPYEMPPVDRANRPTPELLAFRNASRAFGLESRLAHEEGRSAEAIQRALDAIDLGARMGRGGTFLHSLVGLSCTAIGARPAEDLVKKLSAEEAHAAGVRLDGILREFPSSVSVMEGERRISLLSTREILTGQSPLATSAVAFGGTASQVDLWKERALLFFYPKRWAYQRTDRYYQELVAEFRKPYAARKEPATKPPEDVVLSGGMAVTVLSFHLARHELLLQMLRAELALQEARQRDGRYPLALRELVPQTLSAVPRDPFAEQPLRYRRKGSGYLLYSIGPDLKDDGGTPVTARGLDQNSRGDLVAGQLFPAARPAPRSRSTP
jgi:hypothetical protein